MSGAVYAVSSPSTNLSYAGFKNLSPEERGNELLLILKHLGQKTDQGFNLEQFFLLKKWLEYQIGPINLGWCLLYAMKTSTLGDRQKEVMNAIIENIQGPSKGVSQFALEESILLAVDQTDSVLLKQLLEIGRIGLYYWIKAIRNAFQKNAEPCVKVLLEDFLPDNFFKQELLKEATKKEWEEIIDCLKAKPSMENYVFLRKT